MALFFFVFVIVLHVRGEACECIRFIREGLNDKVENKACMRVGCSPLFDITYKAEHGKDGRNGRMKNESASGVLRRQEESLPFCSQTENKDRWERNGRKKWGTQCPKVINEQYQSLETQSIHLFLFLHSLVLS